LLLGFALSLRNELERVPTNEIIHVPFEYPRPVGKSSRQGCIGLPAFPNHGLLRGFDIVDERLQRLVFSREHTGRYRFRFLREFRSLTVRLRSRLRGKRVL
jgi:hypothetical protein